MVKSTMQLKPYIWCVLCPLWAAVLHHPTRQITSGMIRGIIVPGSHEAYLGVPYASAERFQAPKPVGNWQGILDVHVENIKCTQRDPFLGGRVAGTEDCLTLNVYTPPQTAEPTPLRPVMVFIHGGGFRDGSDSPLFYGPEFLLKHDVILVSINYRLEVIGFLCLGIPEAPGNVGMKDQVEALRWVQKNIKAFGGDPDNVTIFGESAGAVSVSLHLVSPMSKGLFHKAIIESGTALAYWGLQYEPVETASLLAKQMNVDTKDPHEIYNLFKSKSAEELLKTRVPRKKGDMVQSENIFVPCIEKRQSNSEPFLLEDPFNLMSKGTYHKVPIIIGHNSEEGYLFVGKENDTTIANFDFSKAMPRNLVFNSKDERKRTADLYKELYLKGKGVSHETLVELSRFEGEAGITHPTVAATEIYSNTNNAPVFAYKFNYNGHLNYAKLGSGFWKAPGATHADELFYIFKTKLTLGNALLEHDMINKVITLWTNFAKYGNPTPDTSVGIKWEPTTPEHQQALLIDKIFEMVPLWTDTLLQWNTTYSQHRKTG